MAESPPVACQPLAIVADDLPDARQMLSRILKRDGFDVIEVEDGIEAVALAVEKRPAVVLLDLVMPRADGLQALREIRARAPDVPVVVVSGVGAEGAERALGLGAVNYLSKPFVPREVRRVLERIKAAHAQESDVRPCIRVLERSKTVLEVGNDVALLARVVAFLGQELRLHYRDRELPMIETKLALYEALANAVEHGNLEIGYDAKTEALRTEGGITGEIEGRRKKSPWKDRIVRVTAEYGPDRVTYTLRDDGPGFSRERLDSSGQLGDVLSLHGRGLILIRHYMSRVAWNEKGNEIRMELDIPPAAPNGRR